MGGFMLLKRSAVCLTILLIMASFAWAGSFEEGLQAYKSGNYAKAHTLWLSEAKQGNTSAQYNLGLMYTNSLGVLQDDKQAVKWYRLAAEQGVAEAQYNLGVMYEQGRGVPQDAKEAVKWYRLAAKQGFANAQYNLAIMYAKGEGVPQDAKEAVKWYRLAAKQGMPVR
jgi:hypothetical protein